uniref:PucR family transcriptional regulator n=1 Tax=Nonomuraea pusilla TaxID=46177 RepID=UPI0006E397C5|nr:helix-turn-helix domain-containing protein [Nonomuraea pusilla]
MSDLHSGMQRRVRELTTAVIARCAADVPFYRELPPETLHGEVTRSVSEVLTILLRTLGRPDAVGPADLTRVIEWSVRRAVDRLPLEAAVTAYLIGAEVWWQALTEVAEPEELAAAGRGMLGCLRTVMPAVALAHQQAQEDIRSEDKRVRRALISALLSGRPYESLAAAAGVEVVQAYEVLLLDLGQPAPPVRLVQSALDAHTGTLVLMDHVDGVALLPGGCALERLAGRLAEVVGRPVLAAAASASSPGAIPDAAREAREVLALVRRLARPPGVYRLDDVLLEHQLARPGAGLARLAAKLAPLDGHPHLLETLRAFVNRGHNRRQTALDLHIHRNTLDYRLRRVSLLTGLDLADPAQARLLGAAVTARDLARP